MARLADGTVTDVTPQRFDDTSPVFTLDGRYLAFLSKRAFDPVYDAHVLELGFLPGVRPHLVTLHATTPSPFTPKPADSEPVEGPDAAAAEAGVAGRIVGRLEGLDVEGIDQRVVAFPVEAGSYTKLRAVRDGVVWLDEPRTGLLGEAALGAADHRPTRLVRYDLVRGERSVAAEDVDDYAVSADGTRLVHPAGNVWEVKAADGSEAKPVAVDPDRIRTTVEPAAEWRHMYHETWRLMRDNYWRADLNGLDWPALGERYRPLVDRVGSADDLLDVLRELQGEVSTSHTGVLPPPSGRVPAPAQALLGADLEPAGDGTWRIVRILHGDSSVAAARSPLAAPGVGAAAGDRVVAVDGQPVDPDLGPNPLLVGKANKPVGLTLRRDGADRRVVVVPLPNEYATRHRDMVVRQRAAVREASGGRLGYLKLPNVMAAGWAELHRDLPTEFDRDGLILDLRETQGGDLSPPDRREDRPARLRLGAVPLRRARELPGRGAPRPRGGHHRRVRVLRRRLPRPGPEVLRRAGGRHPDLGRHHRLRPPLRAARRDDRGPAEVRRVVPRSRRRHRQPRGRAGRRGDGGAARLGRGPRSPARDGDRAGAAGAGRTARGRAALGMTAQPSGPEL